MTRTGTPKATSQRRRAAELDEHDACSTFLPKLTTDTSFLINYFTHNLTISSGRGKGCGTPVAGVLGPKPLVDMMYVVEFVFVGVIVIGVDVQLAWEHREGRPALVLAVLASPAEVAHLFPARQLPLHQVGRAAQATPLSLPRTWNSQLAGVREAFLTASGVREADCVLAAGRSLAGERRWVALLGGPAAPVRHF